MLVAVCAGALLAGCVVASRPPPPPPPAPAPPVARHPAYLHALSDLRSARWLIAHRPGDPAQSQDEAQAIRQIDAAIHDIKGAAIDDGKDLNDHPPADEQPERRGRIRRAIESLRRARQDISQEEDNGYANGLRDRSIGHIDAAIESARRVFAD